MNHETTCRNRASSARRVLFTVTAFVQPKKTGKFTPGWTGVALMNPTTESTPLCSWFDAQRVADEFLNTLTNDEVRQLFGGAI